MKSKTFIFSLLLSACIYGEDINRIRPSEGTIHNAGVINFQWQRAPGDKSPVHLEVRTRKSQVLVLERVTIGTRRTKYLSPNVYEWRIYKNNKITDSQWRSFTVLGNSEVKKNRPQRVEASKTIPLPTNTKTLTYFKEMKLVKSHILKSSKKPSSVEILQWYAPKEESDRTVKIRVRFRGKNTFGELKEQDLLYFIKNEAVEHVENLKAIN